LTRIRTAGAGPSAGRPHRGGGPKETTIERSTSISTIGAQRIMYGSDLSVISSNHSEMENLSTAIEARLSAEEREQIAWKTANQIYKLGLKG
jgi:predicted TIM-barrel fold metal-dependent hydrolase